MRDMSKKEYYQNKNIPLLVYCHKLEPETNLRNHLLDPLPRLATEVKKILSNTQEQNILNLELGNALKIIHQLEDELEILSDKKSQIQERFYECQNQQNELRKKLERLEGQKSELQTMMQKNQFEYKSFLDKENQKSNILLNEYRRRIDNLIEENNKIKQRNENQKRELSSHHNSKMGKIQQHNKTIRDKSIASIKRLGDCYRKINSENSEFRQKIYQLENENAQQRANLQARFQQQNLQNKQAKAYLQEQILSMTNELEILKSQNKSLQEKFQIAEQRLKQERDKYFENQKEWKKEQVQIQEAQKMKFQSLFEEKQRIRQEVNKKCQELNSELKKTYELQNQIEKQSEEIKELKSIQAAKDGEVAQKYKQMKLTFERELHIRMEELRHNIEHSLHKQNYSKIENIKSQLTEAHQKMLSLKSAEINQLESKKSILEHNIVVLEDEIRKLNRKIDIQNQQIQNYAESQKQNQMRMNCRQNEIKEEHRLEISAIRDKHEREIEELRKEYEKEIESYKEYFNRQKSELNAMIQGLHLEKGQLESELAIRQDRLQADQICYINQIQTITKKLQNLQIQKEELISQKKSKDDLILKQNGEFSLLQNKFQNQKSSREQMCREIQDLCERNQSLKQQNFELHCFVSKMKDENSKWKYQVQSARVMMLKEQEDCRKKIRDYDEKNNRLEENLNRLEQEKIQMIKNLAEKDENSKQQWEKIYEEFKYMNQKITKEAVSRQQELEIAFKKVEAQRNNLKNFLSSLESELNHERTKQNQLNLQFKQKCDYIKTLQETKSRHEAKISQLEETESAYSLLRIKSQDDQKIIKEVQANKFELQEKLHQREFEIERLNTIKTQSENSINNLSAKLKILQNEKKESIKKIHSLQKQLLNKQEERIEEINKLREELKQVSRSLEEEKNRCEQLIRENETEMKENEFGYQMKMEELEQNYSMTVKRQQNIIDIAGQENKKYIEMLEEKELEITNLNAKYENDLQRLNKQHEEFRKTIKDYELRLEQVQQNLNNNRKFYESERNKNNELRKENEKLRSAINELQAEHKKLENEYSRMTLQIEKNEKDINKLYEENDRRLEECRRQVQESCQRQIAQKESRIIKLEQEMIKLEKENMRIIQKYQEEIRIIENAFHEKLSQKRQQIHYLTQRCEQVERENQILKEQLGSLKIKWSKIFSDIDDFDGEVKKEIKSPSQFKTQQKRTVKNIPQGVAEQSTQERVVTYHYQKREVKKSAEEKEIEVDSRMAEHRLFSLMGGSESVISSKIIENNSQHSKESVISLGNNSAFVNKKGQ